MNQATEKGEDVSFIDYLMVLAKHSRLILYVSAAAGLLTLLLLFFIPNKYTAKARFLPPQTNLTLSGQLLDDLGGAAIPGSRIRGVGEMFGNLLGLKQPGNLYVGIMGGDHFSDWIIEDFKLRTLFGKRYIEDVRQELHRRVKLGTSDKDGLIFVEVTDKSPQRAAEIANAYVGKLDQQLQKLAVQEARERLAFLEKELTKASHSLAQSEETLRSFSEKSSVLQIDAQTKGMIEYIANLRATIDAKEVELQVLRQRATPSNYDVIRAETEIKGLKEKLRAAESQDGPNPQLGDVMIATERVPSLGLEYMRLYREFKYQEGLYRLYIKLVELARLDEARNISVIQVVDPARPPEKKSAPQRLLITLLVTGVTLVIMSMVAFVREFWQNSRADNSNADLRAQLRQCSQGYRQDFHRFLTFLRLKKQ